MARLKKVEETIGIIRHPEESKRFDMANAIGLLMNAVFGNKQLGLRGLQGTMRIIIVLTVVNLIATVFGQTIGFEWLSTLLKMVP